MLRKNIAKEKLQKEKVVKWAGGAEREAEREAAQQARLKMQSYAEFIKTPRSRLRNCF